jgi:hypothetical protein
VLSLPETVERVSSNRHELGQDPNPASPGGFATDTIGEGTNERVDQALDTRRRPLLVEAQERRRAHTLERTHPALDQGFGTEDRFVVITDGDEVMNVTLFWRDAIPTDWKQLPGGPSRRVAGYAPATMGREDVVASQTEQSVVVGGYGALVVNNEPRNLPWGAGRFGVLAAGFLGHLREYQPFGVQKFEWNPEAATLDVAWVNREVSSPNSVPILSLDSDLVFTVGVRNEAWTVEAIDWKTGRSVYHLRVGDQLYNSAYAAIQIDEAGRLLWGTVWGRARVTPRPARD